ncbi:MAG: T9SS type A sorting domain-containing protein [Flavobacteriales bacterium]
MKQFLTVAFVLICFFSFSQNYIPGTTYFGNDSLIEYKCGNLPIILSAPHGGYETPSALPDRNCQGCVYVRDVNTQELTRQIAASLIFKTGCYPHVIINKLRRTKLDANRDMTEATDSNAVTEPYWHEYMNFVDSAKNRVSKQFTKGLFLDIHGHAHTISRLELGYLLTGTDLRKTDSALDAAPLNAKSSILNLTFANQNNLSPSQLVRGLTSFGALIQKRGYPAVPSDSVPTPLLGEPYFSGGYNTRRFGSRIGGTIDAIQIEHNWDAHRTFARRVEYADSLAETILEYLEEHYIANFSSNYCSSLSLNEKQKSSQIVAYPNPTSGQIVLDGISSDNKIELFTTTGKLLLVVTNRKSIDLSNVEKGVYFIRISSSELATTLRVIKN